MTEHPNEKRRRHEEALEHGEKPGGGPSERELEERLAETERRKEQLQEAWRRRRAAPGEPRPGGYGGGKKR